MKKYFLVPVSYIVVKGVRDTLIAKKEEIIIGGQSNAASKEIKTDPQRMLKVVRGNFSYIYPVLAEQIIKKYGIKKGLCLDVGAGPGMLGIELAKQSDLEVFSLDVSPEMGKIAGDLGKEHGVQEQIKIVHADVHNIPFEDDYFDLVVSRGSFIFWKDKVQAFKEINRVLKPGGIGFIGGGDGDIWPKSMGDKYKKVKFNVKNNLRNRFSSKWKQFNFTEEYWEEILKQAEINEYRIIDRYFWIEIKKEAGAQMSK